MKINERKTIKLSSNREVNPIIWVLFVIYIILSNVVTQLFGMEASRMSGIILLMPVFLMLLILLFTSRGIIKLHFSYYHSYILIFGLFCLISSFWAQAPELSISKGIDIIEIFIIMMIVSMCFAGSSSVDSLLKAIMWSFYLVIIYEIAFYGWDYFVMAMKDSSRVTSEFLNSNTLGMCASFAIIINFYLLMSKKISIWTIALTFFAIVTVFASESRKALFSLFIGIFLYLLLRSFRKDQRTQPFLRFLIALPIVLFALYQALQLPMFSGMMERVEGMLNLFLGGSVEKSAMIRMSLVRLGIDLFKKNPLLGIGIDNPRLYTYGVVGESYYLHNNFVEILSSGGIIGFIVYYWIYVKILFSYIKRHNFDDPQFCICLVLLLLVIIMDYGMVSYYSKTTYIFLLLFTMFEEKLQSDKKERNI